MNPLYTHTRESEAKVSVIQSRLTLCDPVDCSQPGSSAHEILEATILEWGREAGGGNRDGEYMYIHG